MLWLLFGFGCESTDKDRDGFSIFENDCDDNDSTSTTVVPGKDTSYPLTYALPGDNFTHIKSSSGLFPLSVNWFYVYNPPEPTSSFNESWRFTRKGSTA